MEASRYLQCLTAVYGDLRDAASGGGRCVRTAGDPAWADYLRRMLAAFTQ